MCKFLQTLYETDACMHTYTFSYKSKNIPTYVIHAPHLVKRKESILRNLRNIHTSSVTFVTCANRDFVNRLSYTERDCLYTSTFNPFDKKNTILQNGTISLALKHKIAYADIVKRKLKRAVVLEDDAFLPTRFWDKMQSFQLPPDTDIFYMGSYSKLNDWNVLKWDPIVKNTNPVIHKRSCHSKGRMNKHLGAIAYLIYYKGAAKLLETNIKVTPDSALSAMNCNYSRCTFCKYALPNQYGPSKWFVYPRRTIEGSNTHRH